MKSRWLMGIFSLILIASFGCGTKELAGERIEIKAGETVTPAMPLIPSSSLPNPFERILASNTATARKEATTSPDETPQTTVTEQNLTPPPPTPPSPTTVPPEALPAVAAFSNFVRAFATKDGETSWNLLASAAKAQFNTLYAQLQQQAAQNPQLSEELQKVKSGKDLWIQSMTMSAPDEKALAGTEVVGAQLKGSVCVLILRSNAKVNMILEGDSWKVNPGP